MTICNTCGKVKKLNYDPEQHVKIFRTKHESINKKILGLIKEVNQVGNSAGRLKNSSKITGKEEGYLKMTYGWMKELAQDLEKWNNYLEDLEFKYKVAYK